MIRLEKATCRSPLLADRRGPYCLPARRRPGTSPAVPDNTVRFPAADRCLRNDGADPNREAHRQASSALGGAPSRANQGQMSRSKELINHYDFLLTGILRTPCPKTRGPPIDEFKPVAEGSKADMAALGGLARMEPNWGGPAPNNLIEAAVASGWFWPAP